jgi:hypothetical protein
MEIEDEPKENEHIYDDAKKKSQKFALADDLPSSGEYRVGEGVYFYLNPQTGAVERKIPPRCNRNSR